MITYTYKCADCEHVFEAQQRISEDPLTECPECKKQSASRIIISTAGGFRIGGRGVHRPTSRLEM